MSDRAAFERTLARNHRRMDVERREFAERAVAIVERQTAGRERYDPLAHALVMRELDRLLDEFYGAFPGDERARFWRLILDEARRSRRDGFTRGWLVARRILQRRAPGVIRALRGRR